MKVLDHVISTQKADLTEKIQSYLAGEITHADFANYCWDLIDFWKKMEIPEKEVADSNKYIIDCIYTGIRVAEEEQFASGITKQELEKYIELLARENEPGTEELSEHDLQD